MEERKRKMNEIEYSNGIFDECPECKKRANRTLIDKIKHGFSYLSLYIYHDINFITHFKLKFFKQNPDLLAKNGKACIEKYEKRECPNEEHAIIIINHKKPSKIGYVFASGVDLLVNYFDSNSIKFKIYNCYTPECFYTSIAKSKAQNLWIFGHGDRHGISFGKDGYCPFCKIVGASRKSFIGQIHCCHNTGKTVWEYLSDKPGLFSEGFHEIYQNREDIEKWIKENKI
jgi:hypothetical protein